MPFKWKIFITLLYTGLLFSISTFTAWTVFYVRTRSVYQIETEVILLFVANIIFMSNNIFLAWIMNKKFPDGLITNLIEGITYLFSIVLFIACMYVIAYGAVFANAMIVHARPRNFFIIFSRYLAMGTIALSVLHVYIGVNGLLLINAILKRRLEVLRRISDIGKL